MKKLFFFFLTITLHAICFAQKLQVVDTRCQSRQNPIGVDQVNPCFSWKLLSGQRDIVQTAFQILVSDDSVNLSNNGANIWDSKKVSGAASIQVRYSGKNLESAKKYYWKIKAWDNKGNASPWSKICMWQMGLLSTTDWMQAKWIAYAEIADSSIIIPHVHLGGKKSWGPRKDILPLFRKNFTIAKPIKTATAFICGLGHFEMSINGQKIGDHFLDPGWTNYSKHAQYVGFDVTNEIQGGQNSIGVILGNGFYYIPGQRYRKMTGAYGYPKMILLLLLEYSDGTKEDIISDETWKTSPSPIIFSSIYGGEDYDAGKEQKYWDTPDFDDRTWENVKITKGIPILEPQMTEPLKVMQRFEVINKKQINAATVVYDLSQNFSGIPSITVNGNRGDTVVITPAELVKEDGSANQAGSGGASFFTYILGGGGNESWQPRFSYYGFRYLQVKCIARDSLQPLPVVLHISGLHIRNSAAAAGSFTSSNELFNKTNTLIDWAIKSNTVSVFTDCPHREKLGWLEQTHLMGSSVQYNYDIANLNRKVIKDMMNAQHADGKIPEISPEFTKFDPPFDESPEWGSAAVILPWYNYQWYGDVQTLSDAYGMMKAYVQYLKNKSVGNLLSYGLGDWYDIGPNRPGVSQLTPLGVTASAMYFYDVNILAAVSRLMGKTSDSRAYDQLAAEIKKSFNEKYFDKVAGQYASGSQTANAIALYMKLVEPQNKLTVQNALVKDIRKRNNALTAGDIGYRYVLRALEDAGRSDLVFDMNSRDDVPGYGFQLKHGATALTESWQAYPSVSNNHFMLGHLMEWFYDGLAGIRQTAASVGFKEIEIFPTPVGDITSAKGSFLSPYGLIISDWKKEGSMFTLEVTIPVNTAATVYLPAEKGFLIKEGMKVWNSVLFKNGKAIIRVGSGMYRFMVQPE